jgi:hypothetical protein
MAPVTSLDVARLAQVSQSAVSRTFTPGASVSDATRAKVEDAARKLGYRPNAHARSLITKRSRIIGLVLSAMENLFYPVALQRLAERLLPGADRARELRVMQEDVVLGVQLEAAPVDVGRADQRHLAVERHRGPRRARERDVRALDEARAVRHEHLQRPGGARRGRAPARAGRKGGRGS